MNQKAGLNNLKNINESRKIGKQNEQKVLSFLLLRTLGI